MLFYAQIGRLGIVPFCVQIPRLKLIPDHAILRIALNSKKEMRCALSMRKECVQIIRLSRMIRRGRYNHHWVIAT